MKLASAVFTALMLLAAPALATMPQFRGCDTAYYLDPLCKGVGVGVRSSGVYPVNSATFDSTLSDYETVTAGDLADPDPNDPSVKTTADWQAKWGTTNAGMVSFLQAEKSFTNTSRIFYVAQNGNDSTGAVNDPTHPYLTMAPIKTILADLQGGAVIVMGGDWRGADILDASISGTTLTVPEVIGEAGFINVGDTVTGPGVAAGTTIVSQLTNTNGASVPGKEGTYQVSVLQTSAKTAYGVSVGHPLDFSACAYNNGNPCNVMSGSLGHPLYIMAYPGEEVLTDHAWGDETYPPFPHASDVTWDGFELRADGWGEAPYVGSGNGITMADVSRFTFINDEFIGWHENILAENIHDVTFIHDVFHDMEFHGVYYAFDNLLGGPGDFDFAANAATCVPGWYWNGTGTKPAGEACADSDLNVEDSVFYANGDDGYEPIHYNAYINGGTISGNYISYSGGTGIGLQTGADNIVIKDNIIDDNGRAGITLYLYGSATANQCNLPATLIGTIIDSNLIYVGKQTDVIRDTQPGGGIVQFDATNNDANNCPGHWIKGTVIKNNIIVTYNVPSGPWENAPLQFETGSFPETDMITNNLFWNSAPSENVATDVLMKIDSDADSTGDPPGYAKTTVNYTFPQFQAFNSNFNGNMYADPLFTDASPSYTLTPGKFNFTLQAGSPVQ